MKTVLRLLKEEEGQDLVEYALLVAAIALGLVAAVQGLANGLKSVFESISGALSFTG